MYEYYEAIAYVNRPYNMQDKAGHYTIAQLSGHKAAMLASSVQAVVACNASCAEALSTLVLFILWKHLLRLLST